MSIPQKPKPARLIIGVMMMDTSLMEETAADLEERYGPADRVSPWFAFDFTDYYDKEMGTPLKRRLISFQRLIGQETLPEVKLATNEIEMRLSVGGRRRVNIDPGYLTLERFVLATGKNFTHRIYLGRGIYADLTLLYTGGRFVPLEWTYPDYATEPIRTFLAEARERYRVDLRGQPEAAIGAVTGSAGEERGSR
ncbi:MAG: DUF4416 family protein [Desulfobacterales bacterium]|jgi:hypothetical protein